MSGPVTSGATAPDASAAAAPPGIPAPYGRACGNCVKAKCKCFYRTNSNALTVCERCHRLGKECIPSETIRKRVARRQPKSRTAQLEQKLNDLMSLLKTQQQTALPTPNPPGGSARASPAPNNGSPRSGVPPSASNCPPPPMDPNSTAASFLSPSFSQNASESVSGAPPEPTPAPAPAPAAGTELEAEECLQSFSKRFVAYFPFFRLGDGMTVFQLQRERPIFLLAIKSITCRVYDQQTKYLDQLRKTIAQEAVIECQNSLDILLAILAYIGWSHFHETTRSALTVMTHLAISQVIELGLHRPFGDSSAAMAFNEARPFPAMEPARRRPTNEERRAALGCYYITSVVSTTVKKADSLRWTTLLEDMLFDLSREAECLEDLTLVAQVKMQQLYQQMYNARYHPGDLIATSDPSQGLPTSYINLLRQCLKEIQHSFTPQVEANPIVAFMVRFVRVTIAECCIHYKRPPFVRPSTTGHIEECIESTSRSQLENLNELVEALEQFFAGFADLPKVEVYGMSHAFAGMIPHTLWTLVKLSLSHADPVWDPHEVRKRVDALQVIDCIREKLMAVPGIIGLEPAILEPTDNPDRPMSIFAKCGPVLGAIRSGWETEMRKHNAAPATGVTRNTMMNAKEAAEPLVQGCMGPQMPMMDAMGMQEAHQQQHQHQPQPPPPPHMYMSQYDAQSWITFPSVDQEWLMGMLHR